MSDKSSEKVTINAEQAKTIEDCLSVVLSLMLEKDGNMLLQGKQAFDVKGYTIELSAKVISVPFPETDLLKDDKDG